MSNVLPDQFYKIAETWRHQADTFTQPNHYEHLATRLETIIRITETPAFAFGLINGCPEARKGKDNHKQLTASWLVNIAKAEEHLLVGIQRDEDVFRQTLSLFKYFEKFFEQYLNAEEEAAFKLFEKNELRFKVLTERVAQLEELLNQLGERWLLEDEPADDLELPEDETEEKGPFRPTR